MQETIKELQSRIGYNKETERHYIESAYLLDKDLVTSELSDFIYEWSEEIGTNNAYEFTAIGLDILEEAVQYSDGIEWKLQEMVQEQADSYTPIYYHEIGKWLADNVTLVDEVKAELGSDGSDTYKDAQMAYCYTLERVTMALYDLVRAMSECDLCMDQKMGE